MRLGAAVGLLAWGALAASAQTCSGIQLTPPAILPSATVNVSYSASLSGSTSGGIPPYSYSAAVLPPGLGMDSTGLITGIPTTPTTNPIYFTGSVTVTDHCSPPQNATLAFRIQVVAQPLTITTTALLHGLVGSPYSQPIQVSGGAPPYSFSLFRSSLTGTGLGLDTSTGIVSGSPASPGPISFRVEVTDNAGALAFQSYTLQVDSNITVSVPTTGEVPVGGSVSLALSATGGVAPYTWSPVGQLPQGLNLTAAGLFSGTTSQAGNLAIPVLVTDAQNFTAPATVRINSFGISNATPLPPGTTVAPYFAVLNAAGGTPPYNFSGTGLPAGLTINHFGILSGAVTQPGVYSFSAQVQDGTGLVVSSNYSLAINIPPPLTMTAPVLPNGTVQIPYSGSVTGSAAGGNPPYQWSIRNGSLPAGIALSPTGILSGTPTIPGTFTFVLQAIDGSGASGAVGATIQISAALLSITTQSPLTSGVMNSPYPSQVLTAAGGFPPYTFSLVSEPMPSQNLPTGVTLTNGVIGGAPVEAGNYSATITVQDSVGAQATATLALLIRPASTGLVLSTEALSFTLARGASSLPDTQNVTIASSDSNQLGFSVQVTPQSDWLTISPGTTAPGSLTVGLTSQALALAATPGTHTASISLTCTSNACGPASAAQTVAVTLAVNDSPPVLTAVTDLLSFSATSLTSGPTSQPVTLQNTGGGLVSFTSIVCEAPWCSVGSAPAPLAGGSSASVAVTADPTGLPAGYYRTTVDVVSSGGPASIPVTLLIAQASQIILAPSGAQLRMHVGGTPGNGNGSFLVNVSGNATLNWTASVTSGNSWLILNTPSGVSSGSAPGTVTYSIDPSAVALLPAQPQYALIQVNAPGATDSPQYFELILNISQDSAPLTPDPSPAGMVFLTESAAAPPPQTVLVRVAGSAQAPDFQTNFQAAAATSDGANWLAVSASTGSTSSSQPAQVEVSVDPSNLAPGIYHGGVSFSFTAAAAPTVNVTLIVENPLPVPSSQVQHRSSVPQITAPQTTGGGCTPSSLAPTQTGLVNNFSTPTSWPTPLAVLLLDDCGNTISGGQIIATFSNGDPPLALSPVDNSAGTYSGTWTPRSAGPQVSIDAMANASGFSAAHLRITGQVVPNSAPVLTPHGTLHVFNPQVGAPLAPGTMVQIYGSGLAANGTVANTIPLPKSMGGTSVIIGGIEAPLYYVGPGQINAQIPFELDPNGQYQVIANANGSFTTPVSIQLAPVTPGFAAYSDGAVIAQHASDGSLITDASPAQPGEYVTAYLAGLGDTTVPVATGAASPPYPSLAWAGVSPTLTLNGSSVPVQYAGLTPGLVGLYQLNFQIPASQPDGTVTLVLTQSGFASNSTTLPVHH